MDPLVPRIGRRQGVWIESTYAPPFPYSGEVHLRVTGLALIRTDREGSGALPRPDEFGRVRAKQGLVGTRHLKVSVPIGVVDPKGQPTPDGVVVVTNGAVDADLVPGDFSGIAGICLLVDACRRIAGGRVFCRGGCCWLDHEGSPQSNKHYRKQSTR